MRSTSAFVRWRRSQNCYARERWMRLSAKTTSWVPKVHYDVPSNHAS